MALTRNGDMKDKVSYLNPTTANKATKPMGAVRMAADAMGLKFPEDVVGPEVTMKESPEEMAKKVYKDYLLVQSAKSLLQNYGSADNIPREVLQEVAKHGSDDVQLMAVCIFLEKILEAAKSLLETYGNADSIPKAALQEVAQELSIQDGVLMNYCRRAEAQQDDKGSFGPERSKTE